MRDQPDQTTLSMRNDSDGLIMSEPRDTTAIDNRYLRGAHYIMGPFGQDSDLRRWGLKLSERGGMPRNERWLP
jgi:hypothetical protein